MVRVLAITLREVRSYLRDRADLAFSLLLPVAIFALMYGAFSGQTLFKGTAYIVNGDPGGTCSQLLIDSLKEMDNLEVDLLTGQEATAKLDNSTVLLVTYIPQDFSYQLSRGWPTQLTFRQRGNGGLEGQIVSSLVRSAADRLSQEIQIERQVQRALIGKGVGKENVTTAVQNLLEREQESPIVKVSEKVTGGGTNLIYQFLPGIITMFVLFAITMSSRSLVEERKKGTLERLLTTQLSIGQLYAGKFLAGVSRGFIQTLILLLLAYMVFQLFTPLSLLTVLLIALLFTAAASALGLVIASVAHTEDQAAWISVFFTMATVMLGGTFFEISEGSALYAASRLSMNSYVNDALKTIITRGGTLGDVTFDLAVLAGIVVVGLGLSRILFRAIPGGR